MTLFSDSHKRLFNDYLKEINRELAYVQFELRACRNQYDGFVYYGVINTVADEQSKLGTKYTVPQIAFYKGIVGSSEIPPALKNFSMSHKEKAIHEFIQDQWLCATSDGNIGLGVRSFLDLRSWFHNNEVPKCDVCNEAGIKADLCPNENCTVRIHEYCLKAKFSLTRNEKVCPGCGTQWPYVVTKEEAVEEEEDDTEVHQQPPEPLRRKTSRGSRQVQEEGLNEPSSRRLKRSRNNEDQELDGQSQSQPSTQTFRKAKLEKLTAVEVDNVGPGPSTRRATRTSTRLHR
ncbi:putative transcription factor C2H2 family [Helianthus annuus]|nr:putative transcription factor C2H2 family [Helianthus annuus]